MRVKVVLGWGSMKADLSRAAGVGLSEGEGLAINAESRMLVATAAV